MSQISPELERKLTVAIDRMPAFPRSVQKVLELTRNINCLPREIVSVIEKDPVMTMKILKVINSAYYGLPNKITSINQSVVYLGINTIKNLSLSFAMVGILPRTNNAGFDTQRYLIHSLATAATARQLCGIYAKGEADPGDCYVAGLLHDFGKVVFAQFLADEFRTALEASVAGGVPLYQAERQIIGADHGVVGAMLAKHWQFSASLVRCIHDHHLEGVGSSPMMDCLRVADQICRGNEFGSDAAVEWTGRTPEAPLRFGNDLATVVSALGDFESIIAEARTFVTVENEQ